MTFTRLKWREGCISLPYDPDSLDHHHPTTPAIKIKWYFLLLRLTFSKGCTAKNNVAFHVQMATYLVFEKL